MSVRPNPVGWAFLVARTPSDGYRLMLGPAEPTRRSIIVRHARPDADAVEPPIVLVRDDSTALSMVSRTHRLTAADLAPPTAGTGSADLVLDEHGRPIDVVYGFVCDALVREAAGSDLETARRQAVDAYRRVLTGGEPVAAVPYPLISVVDELEAASTVNRPVAPASVAAFRTARVRGVMAGTLTVVLATVVIFVAILATKTSTVTVPATLVGTWTGVYPSSAPGAATSTITLTIACGRSCEVRPGERIGQVLNRT